MPKIVFDIVHLIGEVIRLLGLAAFGVAIGYLALELLRKTQTWPLQAVIFLGLVGLVVTMVVFDAPGALGMFGLGFAAAIFIWGMPRKKKEEKEEQE